MYRSLDSSRIVDTLEVLEQRVAERFPQAGLRRVCAELTKIARENDARAWAMARPNYVLRGLSGLVLAAGLALFGYVATLIKVKHEAGSIYETLQGIDAGLNILILMGVAILFLVTLESRWKRQQALADLDELRSVVHVIDMHQLTKDPASMVIGWAGDGATPSSPKRTMSAFELVRYLDYCSEMLSLAAKVAAVYAQSSRDPQVVAASSDLQQITANLSAKIWQKLNIAHLESKAEAQAGVATHHAANAIAVLQADAPAAIDPHAPTALDPHGVSG